MRTPFAAAVLILSSVLAAACGSTSGPGRRDLDAVKDATLSVAMLRVVVTSNAGRLLPFDEAFEAQCIAVGIGGTGEDDAVEGVDDLDSFSDETLKDGWLYLMLPPGEHVVAFNPPRMWDPRGEERWTDTTHWRFVVPAGAPVVYLGTMQLHCRAEPSDFGGARIRAIRAERLHDESAAAVALAAQHLPGLPPPVTLPLERLFARESGILSGVR